jgi:Transglycosylase SLT domain
MLPKWKVSIADYELIAFLIRLIWQESRFDLGAVSLAGAQGVAQFMPGTAMRAPSGSLDYFVLLDGSPQSLWRCYPIAGPSGDHDTIHHDSLGPDNFRPFRTDKNHRAALAEIDTTWGAPEGTEERP